MRGFFTHQRAILYALVRRPVAMVGTILNIAGSVGFIYLMMLENADSDSFRAFSLAISCLSSCFGAFWVKQLLVPPQTGISPSQNRRNQRSVLPLGPRTAAISEACLTVSLLIIPAALVIDVHSLPMAIAIWFAMSLYDYWTLGTWAGVLTIPVVPVSAVALILAGQQHNALAWLAFGVAATAAWPLWWRWTSTGPRPKRASNEAWAGIVLGLQTRICFRSPLARFRRDMLAYSSWRFSLAMLVVPLAVDALCCFVFSSFPLHYGKYGYLMLLSAVMPLMMTTPLGWAGASSRASLAKIIPISSHQLVHSVFWCAVFMILGVTVTTSGITFLVARLAQNGDWLSSALNRHGLSEILITASFCVPVVGLISAETGRSSWGLVIGGIGLCLIAPIHVVGNWFLPGDMALGFSLAASFLVGAAATWLSLKATDKDLTKQQILPSP